MNKPKITAILPCYNHAKFLHERIISVLSQKLPVSQIIFLDDSSTDGSPDLALKLLRNCGIDFTIRINNVNTGSPFIQWNKGIRLAHHELIWIAETDDCCSPFFTERLSKLLLKHNASLAFCDSLLIDEHGNPFGSVSSAFPTLHNVFSANSPIGGNDFIANVLAFSNLIPNASGVLFRKSKFLDEGSAPLTMKFSGDWLTWIKIARNSTIVYDSEQHNYFRFHSETTRKLIKPDRYYHEEFACRLTALLLCLNRKMVAIQLSRKTLLHIIAAVYLQRKLGLCILDGLSLRSILTIPGTQDGFCCNSPITATVLAKAFLLIFFILRYSYLCAINAMLKARNALASCIGV